MLVRIVIPIGLLFWLAALCASTEKPEKDLTPKTDALLRHETPISQDKTQSLPVSSGGKTFVFIPNEKQTDKLNKGYVKTYNKPISFVMHVADYEELAEPFSKDRTGFKAVEYKIKSTFKKNGKLEKYKGYSEKAKGAISKSENNSRVKRSPFFGGPSLFGLSFREPLTLSTEKGLGYGLGFLSQSDSVKESSAKSSSDLGFRVGFNAPEDSEKHSSAKSSSDLGFRVGFNAPEDSEKHSSSKSPSDLGFRVGFNAPEHSEKHSSAKSPSDLGFRVGFNAPEHSEKHSSAKSPSDLGFRVGFNAPEDSESVSKKSSAAISQEGSVDLKRVSKISSSDISGSISKHLTDSSRLATEAISASGLKGSFGQILEKGKAMTFELDESKSSDVKSQEGSSDIKISSSDISGTISKHLTDSSRLATEAISASGLKGNFGQMLEKGTAMTFELDVSKSSAGKSQEGSSDIKISSSDNSDSILKHLGNVPRRIISDPKSGPSFRSALDKVSGAVLDKTTEEVSAVVSKKSSSVNSQEGSFDIKRVGKIPSSDISGSISKHLTDSSRLATEAISASGLNGSFGQMLEKGKAMNFEVGGIKSSADKSQEASSDIKISSSDISGSILKQLADSSRHASEAISASGLKGSFGQMLEKGKTMTFEVDGIKTSTGKTQVDSSDIKRVGAISSTDLSGSLPKKIVDSSQLGSEAISTSGLTGSLGTMLNKGKEMTFEVISSKSSGAGSQEASIDLKRFGTLSPSDISGTLSKHIGDSTRLASGFMSHLGLGTSSEASKGTGFIFGFNPSRKKRSTPIGGDGRFTTKETSNYENRVVPHQDQLPFSHKKNEAVAISFEKKAFLDKDSFVEVVPLTFFDEPGKEIGSSDQQYRDLPPRLDEGPRVEIGIDSEIKNIDDRIVFLEQVERSIPLQESSIDPRSVPESVGDESEKIESVLDGDESDGVTKRAACDFGDCDRVYPFLLTRPGSAWVRTKSFIEPKKTIGYLANPDVSAIAEEHSVKPPSIKASRNDESYADDPLNFRGKYYDAAETDEEESVPAPVVITIPADNSRTERQWKYVVKGDENDQTFSDSKEYREKGSELEDIMTSRFRERAGTVGTIFPEGELRRGEKGSLHHESPIFFNIPLETSRWSEELEADEKSGGENNNSEPGKTFETASNDVRNSRDVKELRGWYGSKVDYRVTHGTDKFPESFREGPVRSTTPAGNAGIRRYERLEARKSFGNKDGGNKERDETFEYLTSSIRKVRIARAAGDSPARRSLDFEGQHGGLDGTDEPSSTENESFNGRPVKFTIPAKNAGLKRYQKIEAKKSSGINKDGTRIEPGSWSHDRPIKITIPAKNAGIRRYERLEIRKSVDSKDGKSTKPGKYFKYLDEGIPSIRNTRAAKDSPPDTVSVLSGQYSNFLATGYGRTHLVGFDKESRKEPTHEGPIMFTIPSKNAGIRRYQRIEARKPLGSKDGKNNYGTKPEESASRDDVRIAAEIRKISSTGGDSASKKYLVFEMEEGKTPVGS